MAFIIKTFSLKKEHISNISISWIGIARMDYNVKIQYSLFSWLVFFSYFLFVRSRNGFALKRLIKLKVKFFAYFPITKILEFRYFIWAEDPLLNKKYRLFKINSFKEKLSQRFKIMSDNLSSTSTVKICKSIFFF